MNRIALLFASLTLMSCATKPWMVGSVNDRCWCGPCVKVPGGVWTPPAAPPPPPVEMPVTYSGKQPVAVLPSDPTPYAAAEPPRRPGFWRTLLATVLVAAVDATAEAIVDNSFSHGSGGRPQARSSGGHSGHAKPDRPDKPSKSSKPNGGGKPQKKSGGGKPQKKKR